LIEHGLTSPPTQYRYICIYSPAR